ncbi:MAG TPA: acetate--CoA ligase family protein [Acidimicrobiia bacterium]
MGRLLAEHDSLALLAEHGVPVVAEHVAATPADAAAAAAHLHAPVVVKLTGPGVAHKTERGLVRLGVDGPGAAADAAMELLAAAQPDDGPVAVVVAPMVQGTRELLAGTHRDPQFGPCVLVGIGGILAEALDDVAVRLAPLETRDAHEMLDDLHAARVLGPFRGEPPVDRDQVARVLVALGDLAAGRDDVVSIDVNPLVIVDGAPVAVDALVEFA